MESLSLLSLETADFESFLSGLKGDIVHLILLRQDSEFFLSYEQYDFSRAPSSRDRRGSPYRATDGGTTGGISRVAENPLVGRSNCASPRIARIRMLIA
jgi:hypothetical protein